MKVLVAALLALGLPLGAAAEPVGLCYNYGCTVQTEVEVSRAQLESIGREMQKARDAESERRLLAEAVARQAQRLAGASAQGQGRLLLQATARPEQLHASLAGLGLGWLAERCRGEELLARV